MAPPLPARTSAVDACAARLEAAILDGSYGPGDRLPPERTLAETLGVNRTTLRSALTRLSVAGLVVPRQGDGCIVRDFRVSGGLELVGALLEHTRTRAERFAIARDLLAIRRSVASLVLERLVESPPSRIAKERVREAATAFEAGVSRGATTGDLSRLDLEVLAALVDASGSPVVRLLVNPVSRLLADFGELTARLYEDPRRNVVAHEAVLAWLDAPSVLGARSMLDAMSQHDAAVLAGTQSRPRTKTKRQPKR
jgi:GntR family transcriptional repressor for pyruvate dehydrogenase complex